MGDASLRGGSGRGRGTGRGGGGKGPSGASQAPFAAQMRQMTRLQEPDEMSVLRRYRDLGATQVKSIYGTSGLLTREVLIDPSKIPGQEAGLAARFVSVLTADNGLAAIQQHREQERALARREQRLPETRRRVSWGSLNPEEKKILFFSQKEYNSFRASQGGSTGSNPSGSGTKSPTPPPATAAKK